MIIGKVVGNIWATRKEDGLTGLKFLVVQPNNQSQPAFVAVDRIGAGIDDKVIVTKGTPASFIEERLSIDALIIGIVDSIDIERGGDDY
jgi:ethanolamine utilization protein EutN